MPANQRNSIRFTVLAWQLGALLILGLIAIYTAYALATRSFSELRRLELAQVADAVARHEIVGDNTGDEQPGDFLSQVWEADGHLSYASHDPPMARPDKPGYYEFHYGNQLWYGFAAEYEGQTVLVAREAHTRRVLLAKISVPLLSLLLFSTLALIAILAARVRRALTPLGNLQEALAQRHPESLEHVELTNPPEELTPLIETLNLLLDRVKHMIDRQHQFSSDAAHGLRTPVTAIGLYAQLAQKDLENGCHTALAAYLNNIEASCRRASGMIEQLLTLSRLDPEFPPRISPVPIHTLVRNAIADLSSLSEAGQTDLGLVASTDVDVLGNTDELYILIDNLLGNAIRYTPSGGRIDVALETVNGALQLSITDTGPGLPPAELERVFEPFHRVAGEEKVGSGLGLAIVRRIAQRYQLTVKLENIPDGGLRALVQWPPHGGSIDSASNCDA